MSLPPALYSGTDALEPLRIILVLLGLATAITAFVELILMARHNRRDYVALSTFAAIFIACAVVGWRNYPYWTMGVYQVSIGAFPPMIQDPKGLIPMTWIGDLWRMPVILLYLLGYVAIPLFSVAVLAAFWRRRFAAGIVTAVGIVITLVFTQGFSPHYYIWLMD
ncbi:MAG TPA: hypothetical protein VGH19_02880 [Verrucomicrobiae bacterium]